MKNCLAYHNCLGHDSYCNNCVNNANELIGRFKYYCHLNNIKEVTEDIVNDYMFEESIFGEEKFNLLMEIKL